MVMQRPPMIFAAVLFALICVCGCPRTTPKSSIEETIEESAVWLEEGLEFEGITIAVGHRGRRLESGDWFEPIVAITKDGKPVAEAMVFNQLVTPDGLSTLSDEAATIFEPAAGGRPACYAQGKLRLPREVRSVAVRVRIVLTEIDKEWSKDFLVMQIADSTSSQ